MVVTLHPVAEADAAEVLQFELENRAFFGRFIAGVDNGFRYPDAAERFLEGCAESWRNETGYFYLVRNASGELVGRVSLFSVQRGPSQTAQIGYRIAERHGGKGYAKGAVALVANEAFGTHGLHRLEGVTSPTNLASQLVLLKNGFAFWGRSRRSYQLHGVWEDCLFFERLADE